MVGTQILLDAASEFKVPRYVQVSTDEVYGSLGATGLFTEETPLAPNSPYAASKAAADMLVRVYVHTFDCTAVITRCSNNYGPYQFPEKLIPLFISNLLADQQVPVYGDGQQVRDWIHVLDHCRGVELVWRHGHARRGLQLRRPLRESQPRTDAHVARVARQAEVADPLRAGPPGPRPPICHRLLEDRARTRLAAAVTFERRAARHDPLVPRQPDLGQHDPLGRLPRSTTRSSTATDWRPDLFVEPIDHSRLTTDRGQSDFEHVDDQHAASSWPAARARGSAN